MKILVINGPNINMLGIREPEIYGKQTYEELLEFIDNLANKYGIIIVTYQSNHEGLIIDKIQKAYFENYDGIIINAAAYTHTSIAIADAIKAVAIPAIEVHLSDTNSREEFRKHSYLKDVCEKTFCGKGFDSYRQAVEYFIKEKI